MNRNYKRYDNEALLFHYCTLDTFMSIIKKSSIRLSNIRKSNDNTEITYLVHGIHSVCKEIVCTLNKQISNGEKIDNSFIDLMFDETFTEYSTLYYIMCFSEEKDIPDQWKSYADNSCGVAIGFSPNALQELSKLETGFTLCPVIYDCAEYLDSFKSDVMENYRTFSGEYKDEQDKLGKCLYGELTKLLNYAVKYKNPWFITEQEWRLIFNPYGNVRRIIKESVFIDKLHELNKTESYKNKFERKPLNFKINIDGSLRSYFDIEFLAKNEVIKEIVLGSNTNIDDAELSLFLDHHGFDMNFLKITKSSCPVR